MKVDIESEAFRIAMRGAVIAVLIEIFNSSEEIEIMDLISEYAKKFVTETLGTEDTLN